MRINTNSQNLFSSCVTFPVFQEKGEEKDWDFSKSKIFPHLLNRAVFLRESYLTIFV